MLPSRGGRGELKFNRLTLAEFPRQPVLHIVSQSIKVHLEADLETAIVHRQDVIKSGSARETPHREAVEPCQGAGSSRGRSKHVNLDPASEHGKSDNRGAGLKRASADESRPHDGRKKENQRRFGALGASGGGDGGKARP
jgi:hypothetical protein